jgi:hypothetical protein
MILLSQGEISAVAAAPTKDREALYHSIKVPLYMGLLGYRVMIIRKDRYQEFSNIKHEKELKALVACQAIHWPDSDILAANGYKVARVLKFNSMFTLVRNKRCDYFPRAIIEGYPEIIAYSEQTHNDDLMVFDDIILHYKLPLYFYINVNDKPLADALTQGINLAAADGSLLKLMKNHPLTKALFPLTKWNNKKFYPLFNPLLSEDMPINDAKYWIKLDKKSD